MINFSLQTYGPHFCHSQYNKDKTHDKAIRI